MRYFLELSYNGTSYHGWQRQPNAISVQEVIEDSLSTLLRSSTTITGAGRTDAGVHARYMAAHFDHDKIIDTTQLVYKLNAILPPDIAISDIGLVDKETHARFDAISRSYEYIISLQKNPFRIHNAYYLKKNLDIDAMNQAAKLLLNYTNFKCFSKSKTDVKTYNCTITKAIWEHKNGMLIFKITANRFLRNMVRAIVGTLIEIGEEKMAPDDLVMIISSENREKAGYSVPAHGLYLTEIEYPNTIYLT